MYQKFYGLTAKPFQVDPGLDCLYLGSKHRKVLNYLEYGLAENMGIIMLTGEFGSGKTMLTRRLLKKLGSGTETAFISNSSHCPDQLLSHILNKLDLSPQKGRAAAREVITQFAKKKRAENMPVLIVIDDAQYFTAESLEAIRMLSNLQTDGQAMLQIMLVAEPEFIDKIKKLQEVARRIAVHYHLTGLDRKDTGKYIIFRLQNAGRQTNLFTPDAVDKIYRITRGIPRSINLLCQAALVYGYTIETEKIDSMIIEQVAGDKIGFGINFQFEDSSAVAVAESKKEDEILQRIGVLENKINALQGCMLSQLQIENQSKESFKDNLISRMLQIIIDERQNREELLKQFSQLNLKIENLKQAQIAFQNEKDPDLDGTGTPDYIQFHQKKPRQVSD